MLRSVLGWMFPDVVSVPPGGRNQEILEDWFNDYLAQYPGAKSDERALYEGRVGMTLRNYLRKHAPDGTRISLTEMRSFLRSKGIQRRDLGNDILYDGIQVIIAGSRSSGNYMT